MAPRDREAVEQAVVRGSELLKQGQIGPAQHAFRRALELDPDNARVLALLGLSHFRANELADARPIYEQLVERSPTDASHRLNLGLVYLKLNEGDKAIDALEASRALDPSQGRAVSYLGLAYARAGRYAEAYRAFLIAGQNDLAIEIESNLPALERDRIHAQLGRSPQGAVGTEPPPTGPAIARTPTPVSVARNLTSAQLMQPTQPMPTMHGPTQQMPTMHVATQQMPAMMPTQPMPTVQPIGEPPATARAPTPRTRPPGAPPGKRTPSQGLPVVAPDPEDADAAPYDPPSGGSLSPSALRASAAARDSARLTESMQFVMPRTDSDAVQAVPEGPSMISRAVASATPSAISTTRTRAGGLPPRPLSELATDDLIRPDDADDAFEIGANGALILRITERVLTRLDGVHITGGDLAYELAMRRSRGHHTEEAFDHGGPQLHVVTGRGYLIAVPGKHAFSTVSLDDDILYVREDLVFAFQAHLRWENGNVPGLRGKLPVVQFRGHGAIALRLARPLVRVKLPAQGLVFVDAERLAGWIGRVIPRAVVPPPGGPLGTTCVECTGEGVVLIEPAHEDALAARVAPRPRTVADDPAIARAREAAPAAPVDLAAELDLVDRLDGL